MQASSKVLSYPTSWRNARVEEILSSTFIMIYYSANSLDMKLSAPSYIIFLLAIYVTDGGNIAKTSWILLCLRLSLNFQLETAEKFILPLPGLWIDILKCIPGTDIDI